MSSPKLSTFIIIIILFTVIVVAGFTPLLSEINDKYDTTGYNGSKLSEYRTQLNELQNTTSQIRQNATSLGTESGWGLLGDLYDIVGAFFSSGYKAVKVSALSFDIFEDMSENAMEEIEIEEVGTFRVGLTAVVIVAIFLGIIIALVVKRNL